MWTSTRFFGFIKGNVNTISPNKKTNYKKNVTHAYYIAKDTYKLWHNM